MQVNFRVPVQAGGIAPFENGANGSDEELRARTQAMTDISERLAHGDRYSGINYVEIERACVEGFAYIQHQAGVDIDELRFLVESVHEVLEEPEIQEVLRMQRKALDAGFPALLQDVKALRFAVQTKLLYSMQMFKNAGNILEDNDIDVRVDDAGQVLFKKEGQFVPFSEIEATVRYSKEEGRFIGWTFVHPFGFIPKDPCCFEHPFPVAKLSKETLARVKEEASSFVSTSGAASSVPKEYIFQIITAGNSYTENPLFRNLNAFLPEHASLRVITPTGELFSCGTKMDKKDEEFILNIPQFLATRLTKAPCPDYAESYSYEERRITSIPITEENAQQLFSFMGELNKGIPFCFPLQNCTRTVVSAASLIGEEIETRMLPREVVWKSLPSLTDIPYIGRLIEGVASVIQKVAAPIFKAFESIWKKIPEQIQAIISLPSDLWIEAQKKILSVIINIATIFFGSMTTIPVEAKERPPHLQGIPAGLQWFDQLLHWKDVFKEDAFVVYHSQKLREWQLKQASTKIIRDKAIVFGV